MTLNNVGTYDVALFVQLDLLLSWAHVIRFSGLGPGFFQSSELQPTSPPTQKSPYRSGTRITKGIGLKRVADYNAALISSPAL